MCELWSENGKYQKSVFPLHYLSFCVCAFEYVRTLTGKAQCVRSDLNVTSGRDQQRVVGGEVQVGHPASVQRFHAVLALSGANLQQGAVVDVPEL